MSFHPASTIGPLSAYENVDIATTNFTELPYSLQGDSRCAEVSHIGNFYLKEETANSYFVSRNGVTNFTDNVDKAIDSVAVR